MSYSEMSKMKMKSTNVISQWANNIPEVKRWLAKLQDKTGNAWGLYRFCEWSNKQPAELLKMETANKDVEKLLDEFVSANIDGFTNAVKFHCITATKSFFRHNYVDLAKASGALTLEKKKPYNMPTKEGLRKLWSWALNPRDKSLLTFVCSTAIAKETLSRLQWKHLETDWETVELPCVSVPDKLLKGHGVGRYKGVMQTTFLTPEAKRNLQTYKQWIEKRLGRKLTADDHIFLAAQEPYQPLMYGHLGKLIWDLSRNANVPFSWHDARRYVNTAMESVQMSPNWARKIRGRKVKGEESPYSQPAIQQLREKFAQAVPLLEFTSEKPSVDMKEERIQNLINYAIAQGMTTEEAQKMKVVFRQKHVSPEDAAKMIRAALEKHKDCKDGNCQKIVDESELPNLLTDGWRVAAVLPSGKVVVSDEKP